MKLQKFQKSLVSDMVINKVMMMMMMMMIIGKS